MVATIGRPEAQREKNRYTSDKEHCKGGQLIKHEPPGEESPSFESQKEARGP